MLGLGLNESSGELLVTASTNIVGDSSVGRVYILDDNVAPSATLDPVTNADAHSATLNGSVNPNGFHATYRFEYVDDAEFTANGFENAMRIPIAKTLYNRIGNGTSPVALENDIPAHLIPGTTYHVRLVAGQVFSPVETVAGPETFTTDSSAPTIAGIAATVSTDEATLRAAINPENEAVTNYHFNWGPTSAYGNSTPAGNLLSGTDPVAVADELGGLTPGMTYHYQLVATNGTGTTMGPDQTFTTLAQQPGLGPERGYEIVSQNPTGGVPIVPTVSQPDVSPNGDHVLFDSVQPLPGSVVPIADEVSNSWVYASDRGSDAWTLSDTDSAGWAPMGRVIRPIASVHGHPGRVGPGRSERSPRMCTSASRTGRSSGSPGTHAFLWAPRRPLQAEPEIQTTNLSPGIDGPDSPWTMSDDGSTLVFASERPLLDDDPGDLSGFSGRTVQVAGRPAEPCRPSPGRQRAAGRHVAG